MMCHILDERALSSLVHADSCAIRNDTVCHAYETGLNRKQGYREGRMDMIYRDTLRTDVDATLKGHISNSMP